LAIFACCYVTLAQPLDGSISLKFLMETRLETEPFETLVEFLAFLVQKLMALNKQNNELTNYGINY